MKVPCDPNDQKKAEKLAHELVEKWTSVGALPFASNEHRDGMIRTAFELGFFAGIKHERDMTELTELIERLETIATTIGTRIESQGISIFDEEVFNDFREVIEELKGLSNG